MLPQHARINGNFRWYVQNVRGNPGTDFMSQNYTPECPYKPRICVIPLELICFIILYNCLRPYMWVVSIFNLCLLKHFVVCIFNPKRTFSFSFILCYLEFFPRLCYPDRLPLLR